MIILPEYHPALDELINALDRFCPYITHCLFCDIWDDLGATIENLVIK